MIQGYIQWVNKWRWPIILMTLLMVGIACSGIRFLQFTTDYRVFFSRDNPQLRAFEAVQDIYSKDDNVLFVLAPRDGNVFTHSTLSVVEYLTQRAWQIPHSIRVDSLTNFQHSYSQGDELIVEDLVHNTSTLSDEELQAIRHIAINEPLLAGRLISATGHVTGVNVTIQLPDGSLRTEVPEVAAFARRLAEEVRVMDPGVEVYLTGILMMDNALTEIPVKDMRMLMPIMFGVVFVTLGFLLRNFSVTFAILVVLFLAIGGAMGIAGWLGIRMTPPSAASPIIILTLAVADCVHITVSFLAVMRRGLGRIEALTDSLRLNLRPVLITSLTTAMGFLGLNLSDAPPFRDLGNIVAMGVGIALALSLLFLPALLLAFPLRIRSKQTDDNMAMRRLGNFVVQRHNFLFWGMLGLIALLVILIPRNELNDEFVKYFDEDVDFRHATEFTSNNLTGLYLVNYSLNAGESGGIADPSFLQNMDAFAGWYRQQPEVLHVTVVSDVIKRLNMNLHSDNPGWYRIPETRELVAQYLLLYELSLPFGLSLTDQLNVDKSAARLVVSQRPLSSNELLNLEQRAQAWVKSRTSLAETTGTGAPLMFAYIGSRNIRTMLWGTSLALVSISVVLIFALRSFKLGLISLIPNLAPAAMAFGLWGILVGQIGMALSVVTCLTLGIVVDDTIHFLSKYLHARHEQHLQPAAAVQYAFSSVGTAMWVTSLVLILGFSVLTFSSFEPNAAMGLLAAITIGFALLADFLFLPPLLLKLEGVQL